MNLDGTIDGTINDNGVWTGHFNYPSLDPIPRSGTMELTNDGNTLSGTVSGGGLDTDFELDRE